MVNFFARRATRGGKPLDLTPKEFALLALLIRRSGVIEVVCRYLTETEVEVTVCDSGCGIGAEHLPRVFDRFYRAAGSGGNGSEGTGLGSPSSRRSCRCTPAASPSGAPRELAPW